MRSRLRFPLLLLGLLALASPLAACRANPGVKAGIGWASTDAMTGPVLDLGFGTYEADRPFGSPDGAPSTPDPAIVKGLADLDARQAKAAETLATLDAKVASGALTEAQATAIREATAKGEALAGAAREAAAKAEAARIAADAAAGKVGNAPGIPTDWTPTGLLAAAVAAGGYFMRKRAAAAAKAEAARLAAEAKAAIVRATEAFDALPDTASTSDVRDAVGRAAAIPPTP